MKDTEYNLLGPCGKPHLNSIHIVAISLTHRGRFIIKSFLFERLSLITLESARAFCQ